MEKRLHLLESFSAQGSDGKCYTVRGYEHLARLDAASGGLTDWEPIGLAEYRLADGRHVSVGPDGTLRVPEIGLTLQRQPSGLPS